MRQTIGATGMAAGLAVLLGTRLAAVGADPQAPATPPPAPVVVTGWSEALQAPFGSTVRVGVTVENHASTPIRQVHVEQFSANGFAPAGPCWRDGEPACDARAETASPAADLAAGDSRVFAGDLKASVSSGKFQPAGLVQWTDAESVVHRVAVAFPPIDVEAPEKFPPGWLVFWATGLGFPGVVALVGFMVSRHQKAKDAAAKQRQDDAAAAEQKRASRRIEEMSVWRLMLRTSHRDSERHYMPLAGAAREFLEATDDVVKGTTRPHDLREYAALRLVLLYDSLSDLSHKIGGFYFKNREGEKVAAALASLFVRAGLRVHLDENDYMLLADGAARDLRALREAIAQDPARSAFNRVNAGLTAWQRTEASFRPFGQIVHALRVVVKYEANRPEEMWYREVDKFPDGELKADADAMLAAAVVAPADLAKDLKEVARDLTTYATTEAKAAEERATQYQAEKPSGTS